MHKDVKHKDMKHGRVFQDPERAHWDAGYAISVNCKTLSVGTDDQLSAQPRQHKKWKTYAQRQQRGWVGARTHRQARRTTGL